MSEDREAHWSDIVRSTDFYRDILVTILGVLIALAIGSVAQDMEWKGKAKAATSAIDSEWAYNAATFEERTLLQPCLERRVDDLEAVLSEARRTGRIPAIGTYGATPYRAVATAAWEDALNGGALGHFVAGDREALASVYPTIEKYNEFVMQEQQLWWEMRLLADSAGPANEHLLTEVGATLKRLAYRVKINGIIAAQLQSFAAARQIVPDFAAFFGANATRETLAKAVSTRAICKPLARPEA